MNEAQERGARQPLSVRTHILGLILVTLLPMLVFSAFLVIRSAEHEQVLLTASAQDRTRAVAREIEQEVAGLRSQLFILANTVEMEPGDFAQLYARAVNALAPRGLAMVLSTPDGRQLFDTRQQLGAALPSNPDIAAIHRVVATGEPYVGNLIDGGGRSPSIMIDVPVLRDGKVVYVAGLDVQERIQDVVARQQMPAGWLITIADRQGYTIARSRDPQQYTGQPGRPEFLQRVRDIPEGVFPFPSREGIPLDNAFSHVQPVGWTVVVGIPLDVLYAPVRHSTRVLVLVGAIILGIALLLGLLIGHRISGPIHSLVSYATLVGQGQPVPLRLTGLRESDAVAGSLHRASENLQRSIAERELAAAALHASEERKQILHQAVLAQESERTRIARELHDSLGQYLTALQLGLNTLAHGSDADTEQRVSKLRDLTKEVGCEVNRMAWELRPTALDDLGLEKAVTQYLEEWAERSRLQFDLQVHIGDQRLPQTVETTVYRAFQEAVTNIVRHAEAEHIGVILDVVGHQLQLIVEDNGRGFPDEDAGGAEATLRLGLRGIRERLALVDGTLDVESTAGRGTTLFVRVPV